MNRLQPHVTAVAVVGSVLAAFVLRAAPATSPATQPAGLRFPSIPPTKPAEAEKTFRVRDGFRMELIAAEPLVTDPVAIAYDEDGRAYVAEMNDYPYTDKQHHKPNQENPTDRPIGRVRLLVDTNGDGKFDRGTVFAEGLSWPTGIACWKGGVFVAATPDIWYLKDTDGDGSADLRVKVFTGFRKLNVQAVMNNLIWGLDHRIYGAASGNGGQVRPADDPAAKPVVLSHNDFRFDPSALPGAGGFEAISGGARFGNTFDDWGNRFLCNIRNPVQHVVLEGRYLARNPFLPVRSPLHDAAEAGDQLPVYRTSPPEAWREFRARRWSADPAVRATMPRSELVGAGVVTSSSGVTVYRGSAYPEKYRGNAFVADVAGNLFYRLNLAADGVTFKATRADEKVDFVTSTDVWFRPVNFVNAPDGTLHVLDMYREVIEHPWSIPDDIHAALDLERGRDRGRIYRLAPPGFRPPRPPRLGWVTTAELVAELADPNAWRRETAHRLIYERQDRAAVGPLRDLAAGGAGPLARLHALWSLQGLGALEDQDLLRALGDGDAGVREHAVRLAESRLRQSPKFLDRVLALADDPAVRVRFQVALSLGEASDPRVPAALAAVARRDAADPWVAAAVGSSAAATSHDLLAQLLGDPDFTSRPDRLEFVRQLARVVGARNKPAELHRVLAALAPLPGSSPRSSTVRVAHAAVFQGLAEGLKRHGRGLRRAVADAGPPEAVTALDQILAEARRTAPDAASPPGEREQAVRLLAVDDFESARPVLADLLDPHQPREVQRAAVSALDGFGDPRVGPLLLSGWRTYTPAVRGDVVQAMLGRKDRLIGLLDAIEAGQVAAGQVPLARRAVLLRHPDPDVRGRAERLFGSSGAGPPARRKDVIDRYQPALQLPGDAGRGRRVFEATCATCHRLGDVGNDVGPNLASVRQWSPDQLLVNILDPNREVAPNFVEYVVELEDGRTLSGIVADETATGITLRQAGGAQVVLLRRDVRKMFGSGLSLMPEGLESAIDQQQMADLLALLRSGQ